MKRNNRIRSQLALKGGSYSLIVTAVVLALLIVVNLFVSAIPATLTRLDISSSQLYSITSNTKAVVNNLEQDVTIYWIVQSNEENSILENLLDKYDSLSGHISVVKKNPDVFPTFAAQYTDETVLNNSLIVESGERYRYIDYYDIFETEFDYSSYGYVITGFDGEGAITSAIDYVVTEDLPKLYILEGHGEEDLPSTFTEQVEKENYITGQLSLLTVDEIPGDASCLLIYAPTSDISEAEYEMLASYVTGGGKLLVMAGPTTDGTLENLYHLVEDYGVEPVEGIIIEGDRESYAFGSPYTLIPTLESHEITNELMEGSYYIIMPIAQGMTVSGSSGTATVTELMTTTDESFSKVAGYSLSSYEMEEDDIAGGFAVAVSIENTNEGGIVWFSSSYFLDDLYNAYSSGANVDMAMNALSSLVGQREAIAIRSKSLSYHYLTISESAASTLKMLMIGVIPLAYLGIGIVVILKKKKVQNEKV